MSAVKPEPGTEKPARRGEAFVPSHGHGRLIPWAKGQSGNSRSSMAEYHRVLHLARDKSWDAMQKLIALMDDKDHRIALVAADKVLERAWGKVKEIDPGATDQVAEEERQRMRAEVIRMLQALARAEPLTIVPEDVAGGGS